MMNAEITSDTSRSRAQTATTGRDREAGCVDAIPGNGGCGVPTSDIVSVFYTQSRMWSQVRGQIAEVKKLCEQKGRLQKLKPLLSAAVANGQVCTSAI